MKIHHMFFLVLLIASVAQASPKPSLRPGTLVCASQATTERARSFTIEQFDTRNPVTDLDAGMMSLRRTVMSTEFCASNECDNSYCWTFYNEDLDRLARGKVTEIQGLMNYFNSDSETDAAETALVRCGTRASQ